MGNDQIKILTLKGHLNKILLHFYYWGNLSRNRINHYQKLARDEEWKAVMPHIPRGSEFLDVGCGSGYNMQKASEDLQCHVSGIDPEPFAHGVDRNWEKSSVIHTKNIHTGSGEDLPFEDNRFDIVFSSHVLEHADNATKMLNEMKRVAKPGGIVIIGVPTATMACLNLFTSLLFTTHQQIFNFVFSRIGIFNAVRDPFKNIFIPPSHSEAEKTVLHDLKHYRVSRWKKTIGSIVSIEHTVFPALYPYPDYRQFFKLRKLKTMGSSVFFICRINKPSPNHCP
jgi:ubiquinone/menaquinone biosynthesis C-methylase UbiE